MRAGPDGSATCGFGPGSRAIGWPVCRRCPTWTPNRPTKASPIKICSVSPRVSTRAASEPAKVAINQKWTSQRLRIRRPCSSAPSCGTGEASFEAGTEVLCVVKVAYSIGRVEIPFGSRPASTQPTNVATIGMAITMRNRLIQGMCPYDVRQATLQGVRAEPSGQPDVGGHRPEQRAEEGEAAGGDRRQAAPGTGAGAGSGQRAQLARRLAPDEADAHGEDAEGECDAEHGGPIHDLGRARVVVLRLDGQVVAGRQGFGVGDLGGGDRVVGLEQPAVEAVLAREVQPVQCTLGDHCVGHIRAGGELALSGHDRVGEARARRARVGVSWTRTAGPAARAGTDELGAGPSLHLPRSSARPSLRARGAS